MNKEFSCPDGVSKPYYPVIRCSLNDKPCVRESGYSCPYYEEAYHGWLEEVRGEKIDRPVPPKRDY